jgi:hypothetical protein
LSKAKPAAHLAYGFLWLSLAHKTPSYDTKMLLEVVFDKTAFVKFKINNNLKQNIDGTHSKQPKIHRKIYTYQPMDFKTLKKKIHGSKVSRLLSNVCDFQRENHTLRYGLKVP